MKYSPYKISLILSLVLLALYGLTYFSSSKETEEGKYQEGFFVGDFIIKYPLTSTFLEQQKELAKADHKILDSIVANVEELIVKEDEPETIREIVIEEGPTITLPFVPKIPDLSKTDTSKVQRIRYPDPKFDFIDNLRENLRSPNCRIIHYGDSQIEGDRISAYLRNRLQGLYGGSGPGFVPIVQVYNSISASVTHSENWTRHAYFDPKQEKFEHKKYGAYNSLSRFTMDYGPDIDSTLLSSLPLVKATITIGIPTKSYGSLKKFSRVGLHYGNALAPTSVKVYKDDVLIKSESLIADGNYHKFNIELASTPDILQIVIESKISPDFYGLTLDGTNGISLDNVAMRGSSGTVFAGTNATTFQQMYNELKPKLLIFQYGGNAVPYLKDSAKVKEYSNYIKNHVLWAKRKAGNASVIFVGPSDMTTTINGQMETYPLLPFFNETLQDICLKNGIAYWDMFKAMGGKNAMKYWVEQQLAANDYTHFSPSGTKVISELFFLALYLDINDIL